MISYGDLSDAQLLQTYGFVEEYKDFSNPWNFVKVPSNTVAQVFSQLCMLTLHWDQALQGGTCSLRLQAAHSAGCLVLSVPASKLCRAVWLTSCLHALQCLALHAWFVLPSGIVCPWKK